MDVFRPATLETSSDLRTPRTNSQISVVGASNDSSPSASDEPVLAVCNPTPASRIRPASTPSGDSSQSTVISNQSNNNSNSTVSVPSSNRSGQRRRSTRHQNYLNRSQLHQAVDLPEGYGRQLIICDPIYLMNYKF